MDSHRRGRRIILRRRIEILVRDRFLMVCIDSILQATRHSVGGGSDAGYQSLVCVIGLCFEDAAHMEGDGYKAPHLIGD